MKTLIFTILLLTILSNFYSSKSSVNEISVDVHDSTLENINSTDYIGTTFKFCTVSILNSNPDGFFFIIKSNNGQYNPIQKSKLFRENKHPVLLLLGDYHYYSFVIGSPSGSIQSPNTLMVNNAIKTGSIYNTAHHGEVIQVAYHALPSNVTSNASIPIYIESNKNDKLFRGNFYDTISFTLKDI